MLAQLQLQEEQYAERWPRSTASSPRPSRPKPEHLVIKGNALYQLERTPKRHPVLKQAIEASPEPKDDWQQLLMAHLRRIGPAGEAAKLAEELIAAKNPNDKRRS